MQLGIYILSYQLAEIKEKTLTENNENKTESALFSFDTHRFIQQRYD